MLYELSCCWTQLPLLSLPHLRDLEPLAPEESNWLKVCFRRGHIVIIGLRIRKQIKKFGWLDGMDHGHTGIVRPIVSPAPPDHV